MLTKYDWKKQDKALYLPKNEPAVIQVPPAGYFMVNGRGNPNHAEFQEAVGVLYSLTYGVKMMPKKGITPDGYYEFRIFPLEGVWDLEEEARGLEMLDKDKLVYTIMIRQPDFVTESLAMEVMEAVRKKKPSDMLNQASFGTVEDGLCIQMMHYGPYDDEPASFARMEQYGSEHGYNRLSLTHKEIYISDVRKTAPEKLRTVLRYKVERQA